MTQRTLTAMFDSRDDADDARQDLLQAGVPAESVTIVSQESSSASTTTGDSGGGFLSGLKDFFMGDDDRQAYNEGVRRGGYLLTARVEEQYLDQAYSILEDSDAIDFDERQAQWRSQGWSGQSETQQFSGGASDQFESEQRIPIVEEQLRVGKREVERGGVRVRSYVEETPVNEQVTLREEHVNVERRPLDQRLSAGDADQLFQQQEFSVTETAEEAVVAKEATIREELVVSKQTDQRQETIQDTVRRTQVDVEQLQGHGSTMQSNFSEAQPQGFSQSQPQGFSDSQPSSSGQGQTLLGGENPSFAAADTSIAMDPNGGSVIETEEERRQRLQNDDQPRSPSL